MKAGMIFTLALLTAQLRGLVEHRAYGSGPGYSRRAQDEEPAEEEAPAEELPEAVNFVDNSEEEHMRNFRKISADLKVYEEEYATCIKEIADEEYTEEKVEECIGSNFIKVVLDIKYETLKVMARADTRVRKFFVEHCYVPAGEVEEFSVGCDHMERDTLDMLWNGIDFVSLLELNRDKYLIEYGKVPEENYKAVMDELTDFSKEFFELLDEVDSHKEVTILRLKTLIDDRTKLLLEDAKLHPDNIRPATIHHQIEISEQISGGDAIKVHELPPEQEESYDAPTNFDFVRRRLDQNHGLRQRDAASLAAFRRRLGQGAEPQKTPRNTRGGFEQPPQTATYSRARPAQGYASQEPLASRHNSRRVFNSGFNYSGLHSRAAGLKFGIPGTGARGMVGRTGFGGARMAGSFAQHGYV